MVVELLGLVVSVELLVLVLKGFDSVISLSVLDEVPSLFKAVSVSTLPITDCAFPIVEEPLLLSLFEQADMLKHKHSRAKNEMIFFMIFHLTFHTP